LADIIGTSFATSGFSYDPNLSPNNRSFGAAVLAVVRRAGFGTGGGGGGGTGVTGVALADNSASPIYVIGGSPITSGNSGTLTITLGTEAANQVLAGPTSGGNAQPTFRSLVAGDLPAGLGTLVSVSGTVTGAGSAAVTLSNVPLTGAGGTFTLAISTFAGTNPGVVPSSAGGTVNFLRADGAFAAPPSGGGGTTTFSNPTVLVSLTATNGTSTAAMRSDAAPALDTNIAPVWSQGHQWQLPDGEALVVQGGTTPGLSLALQLHAGYNSSDIVVYVTDGAGTQNFFEIDGDGSGHIGPNTGTGMAWTAAGNFKFNGPEAQVVLGTSTSYAWGTGTHYPTLQFAGVGAIYGTATTGIVLTGGGLYWNGTKFIYGQAGTGVIASLGTGSFTVSCLSTSGTAGGTGTPTVVFSIGGTVTSNTIQGYGPTKAGLVDMTPDTGTFTGTFGGLTAAVTGVAYWARSGNLVTVQFPYGSGSKAGAAGTLSFAPIPAAIQPKRATVNSLPWVSSGGTNVIGGGQIAVSNSATATIWQGAAGLGFAGTAAAVVGISGYWQTLQWHIA